MEFEFEKQEKKDIKVNLFFVREGGEVKLKVRNNRGEEKFMMSFADGRFYRTLGATIEGLETDEEGRIEENK